MTELEGIILDSGFSFGIATGSMDDELTGMLPTMTSKGIVKSGPLQLPGRTVN